MIGTWHNNLISKKLNEEYKHDFSIMDIDGAIRWEGMINGVFHCRFIIYESKNEYEKDLGYAQKRSLMLLNKSIDWTKFDSYSGLYVLKIINLDNEIIWFNIYGEIIRQTTFDELYDIFSGKI